MKLHLLKQEPQYYEAVMKCSKKAELRINDRDFKVGDLIHFTRVNGDEYDSSMNAFIITHIIKVSDITLEPENKYVVLSIEPFSFINLNDSKDPRRY